MTGILFLAAFVGLPLVGAAPILSRRWKGLSFGGAVASAAAVGAVILCAEMFALTVARVPWTPGLLLAAPAVAIAIVVGRARTVAVRVAGPRADRATPAAVGLLLIAGAALALVAYAAMTARVTSSDLHLFWAAKGERFGLERRIDADFLGRADHRLMHSDYPPLWPCLYGFGTMLGGRFAWGASLATLPLFLALSVVAVASFARRRLGSLEAAGLAAAFASLFGFLLSVFMTAGGADPPLLFFETLALCLVVFARDEPGAFVFAGIALAGATWLKLEGIAFGWAVIAAAAIAVRPLSLRKLAQLAAPPLIAYGTWMAFCRAHDLLDTLASHRFLVTGERLRTIAWGMLRAASMESGYLPWVLVVLLFVLRRPGREAAVAVLVAAFVAAFDGAFYLAAKGDPTVWITMAGPRTLVTPLMALLLAAMAPGGATASEVRRGAAASSRP
jgi:hypothetical protein